MIVGYINKNLAEAKIQEEYKNLIEAGCDKIVINSFIIKKWSNSSLAFMQLNLTANDTFIFINSEHLGLHLNPLLDFFHELIDKGIYFKSLTEPFFDTTPNAVLSDPLKLIILQLISVRNNLFKKKTKIGLAIAKSNGVKLGKPKGYNSRIALKIENMVMSGESMRTILKSLDISRTTYYRYLEYIGLSKSKLKKKTSTQGDISDKPKKVKKKRKKRKYIKTK